MSVVFMTVPEKLEYLNETKSLIKDSLNDLGAELTQNDSFRSYVTKINELYSEYPQVQSLMNNQEETPEE